MPPNHSPPPPIQQSRPLHHPPPASDSEIDKSPHAITTSPPSSSRRIPVTHLLNFEVANNEAVRFIGTSPSRKGLSGLHVRSSIAPFNKQRYIHASFRFLCLGGRVPEDVDTPVPWENVEAVIVPFSPAQLPACPVCLETPIVAPRMTCCGHVFCWTCLLRYIAESARPVSTSPGSGSKWRKCPICFEPMHEKQLRSVIFQSLSQEVSESGTSECDFVLLSRKVGECDPTLLDNAVHDVFTKVSAVTPEWIKENIIGQEQKDLTTLLEDECAAPYAQVALTLCEDRIIFLDNYAAEEEKPMSPPAKREDLPVLYFHQAVDGQNIFLLPLCIKILNTHFRTYSEFPVRLKATVLELEWHAMTFENRKRFKHIAHLPLGAQFALAEVDLTSVLPPSLLKSFEPELAARREQREARLALKNAPRKASLSYSAASDFFPAVDDFEVLEPESDLTDPQQFPALFPKSASAEEIGKPPVWSQPPLEPTPSRSKKYTISGGSMHFLRKR